MKENRIVELCQAYVMVGLALLRKLGSILELNISRSPRKGRYERLPECLVAREVLGYEEIVVVLLDGIPIREERVWRHRETLIAP